MQLHLHLLTKQLRESNILPSPVFSTMFALQPSSPLQTSFIPLQLPRLMEPRLTRYEAQVNLSKSDVAPKDERSFGGPCCEVWWGRRKERNGDDTNTQIQLHTQLCIPHCCNLSLCLLLFSRILFREDHTFGMT